MSRGFSTLEIMIAMAILLSAFTVTILVSYSADTRVAREALALARESLEVEQSLARKDFKLAVATTSLQAVDGTVYSKNIVVEQTDFFTKKLTATVSWVGTYGRSPTISLISLVTNLDTPTGADTCSSVFRNAGGAGGWKTPVVSSTTFASVIGDTAAALYPVTDIEAYQHRLYVSVATTSSLVGPRSPAAAVSDSSVGNVAWANVSNAKAPDAVYATATLGGGQTTHYLIASNFGFTIPAGATILGIKAEIERKGSSTSNLTKDSAVRLVRADGTLGSLNQASTLNWPTSEAYKSYGDTTDLWGESGWSPAVINNPNFGIAVSATANGGTGSRTASVDHVRITVYYTKQFYIIDVTNPTAPALMGGLAVSTFGGGANALVVATSSTSNYAYLALNSTATQLEVVDVTNPAAPFVKSTYTVPGALGTVANSIFYRNGYVYLGLAATGVGVGKEFHIIDVSNPAAPTEAGYWPPSPPSAPAASFNNNINAILVKDGYAYLATPYSPELIVLDVTSPGSPTIVGTYDAPDTVGNGKSLYSVGDTLYLGRTVTGANAEFSVLDAADLTQLQSHNTAQLTKEVGSSVLGLLVRDSLAFLLTTKQGARSGELKIINATSTTDVATVSLPGTGAATGVALDCEGNYLYAASSDAVSTSFLTIVTGQ